MYHLSHREQLYLAAAFQDPECRNLPRCTAASVSFSSSPEIGFIHFDLTGKGLIIRIGDNNRMTEDMIQTINGVVCETKLFSWFSYGSIKLKQLDCHQKFCERYLQSFKDTPSTNAPLFVTTIAFEFLRTRPIRSSPHIGHTVYRLSTPNSSKTCSLSPLLRCILPTHSGSSSVRHVKLVYSSGSNKGITQNLF